jgi:hypothetical protein
LRIDGLTRSGLALVTAWGQRPLDIYYNFPSRADPGIPLIWSPSNPGQVVRVQSLVTNLADAGLRELGSLFATEDLSVLAGVARDASSDRLVGVRLWRVGCNTIDFNNDGLWPDLRDVVEYLEQVASPDARCIACDSTDFNNDGVAGDLADTAAFLEAFAGVPCP